MAEEQPKGGAADWLRPGELAIGAIDIGTRFYCGCVIAYTPAERPPPKSRKRTLDETVAPPPDLRQEAVRVLSWRYFDLTMGRVIGAYDAPLHRPVRNTVYHGGREAAPEDHTDFDDARALYPLMREWACIYETCCPIYTEVQWDAHARNGKPPIMYGLSLVTAAVIKICDGEHHVVGRVVAKTQGKAGVPKGQHVKNGDKEHKKLSIAHMYTMLRQNKDPGLAHIQAIRDAFPVKKEEDHADTYNMALFRGREDY